MVFEEKHHGWEQGKAKVLKCEFFMQQAWGRG